MKKATLKSRLGLVNMGHDLKITSYWVKDAWLLRVIDPAGNRVRGGYALLNDNNSDLAADSAALENIIQFRDQEEKKQRKAAAPKRPDVGRPGNEFQFPTFREPDLSGIEEPDLSGIETPEEVLESLRDLAAAELEALDLDLDAIDTDLSEVETRAEILASLRDQDEEDEDETPARPTPGEAVFLCLTGQAGKQDRDIPSARAKKQTGRSK